MPAGSCALYYCWKFIVFEIFCEEFQLHSQAVGVMKRVQGTISVHCLAHAHMPLNHIFAMWVSRAGGTGQGLQHQLGPRDVSAWLVLPLCTLLGFVLNFSSFDMANLLEFFGR